MRAYATIILLVVAPSFVLAQGHEPVFPELTGDELFSAVVDAYKPAFVLDSSNARDTLFGSIYRTAGDSLECVYTGWTMYLPPDEDPTQAAYLNGFGINTEHTWPQANFLDESPARTDMHHLYPTRTDVNADRNNFPFQEISDGQTDRWYWQDQQMSSAPSSNRDAYSELLFASSFEPRESFKGNVARAMFYIHTIYRADTQAEAPDFFAGQQATLCAWHAYDPIDADEWNRTWQIATHQDGKPNPFVIDCTLAARLYCPELLAFNCVTGVPTGPVLDGFVVGEPAPNPSRGAFRINTTLPAGGELSWYWRDAQGRLVTSSHTSVQPGTRAWAVNLPYAGYWYGEVIFSNEKGAFRQVVPVVVLP
ncbi:MAG: endonuclease [Lewinella sp.]|nr:endonuclease [Lewinella sp.]